MTVEKPVDIVMDTTPSTAGAGAKDDELNFRPMHCELNALSRADGSALFTQGTQQTSGL